MRYFVADWKSRRSRSERRWNPRPKTAVWTAVIVMGDPLRQRGFQVVFRKRLQRPARCRTSCHVEMHEPPHPDFHDRESG